MADLRLVSSTAAERLAARIAAYNGLDPQEGGEEAGHAVRFLSALLGLPSPDLPSSIHGQAPKSTEEPRSDQAA